MGDLITAVSHDLPVKLVVFDNGRLGMVKLEMEQVGLPEFGTVLHNPDFAARGRGRSGMQRHPGGEARTTSRPPSEPRSRTRARCWSTCVTNPDEVAIPPKPTLEQGWGFAIAKTREFVDSAE